MKVKKFSEFCPILKLNFFFGFPLFSPNNIIWIIRQSSEILSSNNTQLLVMPQVSRQQRNTVELLKLVYDGLNRGYMFALLFQSRGLFKCLETESLWNNEHSKQVLLSFWFIKIKNIRYNFTQSFKLSN